jgi:hypothetical protein
MRKQAWLCRLGCFAAILLLQYITISNANPCGTPYGRPRGELFSAIPLRGAPLGVVLKASVVTMQPVRALMLDSCQRDGIGRAIMTKLFLFRDSTGSYLTGANDCVLSLVNTLFWWPALLGVVALYRWLRKRYLVRP